MASDEPANNPLSTSSITPTYIDGTAMKYTNNKAHIPALLHEWGLWCIRTSNFIELCAFRGVICKQFIAVDNASAAFYVKSPNVDHPLEPEIAQEFASDRATFDKKAKEMVDKHAR